MPDHHYASARHYKRWADDKNRVCVLREDYITPFNPPTSYWNNNDRKTYFRDIGLKSNYSLNQENEDEVTAIEKPGHDIIDSILKNKVLPDEVDLDPIYKLIALFVSNNPTFRGGIKNALNKNREKIIAALQTLTEPPDQKEFFMAAIKSINPLSDISLQIADETLYPHIRENFRFRLLVSHPKKSFITSEIPVILIVPSNNHPLFNIGWRITKFTWFYENGAMGELKINLNNEGQIEGFSLSCPEPSNEYVPLPKAHFSYQYHILEFNIHQIYFPISP